MSKTERIVKLACALGALGLNPAEIVTLMRAERRLHRWHEWQCGMTAGHVEQDDAGQWWRVRNVNGREYHRAPVRDAGAAARRQVERVLDGSGLAYYVQTDPRGCALYILRRGVGRDEYHRGVAVCV